MKGRDCEKRKVLMFVFLLHSFLRRLKLEWGWRRKWRMEGEKS